MYIHMLYNIFLKTLEDFRYKLKDYYYQFYFNYLYHYRIVY